MKQKNMRRLLVILSVLCILSLFGAIVYVTTGHASDKEYNICVHRCYLDLPDLEECIKDETNFWDTPTGSEIRIQRDCKDMINHEKIDCRINCVREQIKPRDASVEFYDKHVRSFPETND